MKIKTDAELMQRVQDKDRPALEELYNRYVKLVYSFALKSTRDEQVAKEIVQQVYLRLWITKSGYDSGKGQFVNWLLTLTRNIAIDRIRKERKHKQEIHLESKLWNEMPEQEYDVFQQVSQKLLKEQIKEVQNRLSETQRRLIQLLYWEGYTLREIAEIEQEPLGTIKSRLHQTLKVLRPHFALEKEV